MEKTENIVRRSMYIDLEIYEILEIIAKIEGRSRPGLIRTVLEDYVKNYRLTREQLKEIKYGKTDN